MYQFQVPPKKRIRLIVNSDAKNEADDQFAIVHALLTPKFIIKGLIGAHFGNRRTERSMEESYEECKKVLALMEMPDQVAVLRGATREIQSEQNYEYSEGARLIVEEALADDPAPLFVIFLGPITDLACAYLQEPRIAGRLTAIWIGGGKYPTGGPEFNLRNDIRAANVVFRSGIELWQVPVNAYSRMLVSLSELQTRVAPCGKIGEYLFRQMVEFNDSLADQLDWPTGECWCLGDSPAVGLLLDRQLWACRMQSAPQVNEDFSYSFPEGACQIRVYEDIDSRFIFEDMYAKLKLFAER